MKIDWIEKEDCTGCLACVAACNKTALNISRSNEGFFFPIVDENACSDCGKCRDTCLGRKNLPHNHIEKVYSLQTLNSSLLLEATSGGAFELFAREIIAKGGIVFGASYDDSMNVIHTSAESLNSICKMNGSKYVQSNPKDAYLQVKYNLELNRTVLFSGTPCQISGLLSFLGGRNDLLYTIDIPCYGIPSSLFFAEFIEKLSLKLNGKIIDFRFRDKHRYGFSHTTVIKYLKKGKERTKTIKNHEKVPYHFAFAKRDCYQKKCYKCDFANPNRLSDITIGSFWGIDKITPFYDIRKGVSMVLINSDKGESLFQQIMCKSSCFSHSIEQALNSNDALKHPIEIPSLRDTIISDFMNKGYDFVAKKYYRRTIAYVAKKIIRRIIKNNESK